mgnify:CR=1 FL=1|tara:strand:+ start:1963 stop:2538 length:576 start_codon:yes stop_codon:yes gene_type:complete
MDLTKNNLMEETEKAPAGIGNLEIENGTELSEKDAAFINSSSGARSLPFGGRDGGSVELQAFNTYRQVAAQKIGMNFFSMGEDALSEFMQAGTYNGIFLDAILTVYLCTQPESVARRSLSAPSAVQGMAMAWAEKNSILVGNDNHGELLEAFGAILRDIFSSQDEIDETGLEAGDPDAMGKSAETSPSMSD